MRHWSQPLRAMHWAAVNLAQWRVVYRDKGCHVVLKHTVRASPSNCTFIDSYLHTGTFRLLGVLMISKRLRSCGSARPSLRRLDISHSLLPFTFVTNLPCNAFGQSLACALRCQRSLHRIELFWSESFVSSNRLATTDDAQSQDTA